jgi:hypothetical protein
MQNLKLTMIAAFSLVTSIIYAQSPVSGFMTGKKHGALVKSYSSESYESVFLVPNEIKGVPVFNDVKIVSKNFYATYGISEKLDVSFNLPYIIAKGNASQQVLTNLNFKNERRGFQDFSLHLKYNPYSKEIGKGKLNMMLALGLQTPAGKYKVDEGLQSILALGNRSTNINAFAIANYKMNNGFFSTAQVGYSKRSNGVSDAILGEVKVGFAASKFYVDAYLAGQNTLSGTDILQDGFNGVFPSTRVSYSRIGGSIYVPVYKGFGISGGANTYLKGRNVGKSTGFYGALVYSF